MPPMRNSPTSGESGVDQEYDYDRSSSTTTPKTNTNTNATTSSPSPRTLASSFTPNTTTSTMKSSISNNNNNNSPENNGGVTDGEEALLDLAQLEELHQEAERMKALGNKHMAAQEYTRAYNAYSAALQLSPVGPSSHVFLSNRAAALLSLKRYGAAATDARRAVALAPTFGKAHARLGQALYFLKEYAGAVAAYEDAIQYEPDNQVTQTYLEKAKAKLAKQQDKAQRSARGEDVSVADYSAVSTVINSVATDPNASAAIVSGEFQRTTNLALANAIAGRNPRNRNGVGAGGNGKYSMNPLMMNQNVEGEEDPDFDEALSIQKRANRFLANKQYKQAIEEYSAALFLVPDDPNLSPQLHLGRAHALNGSRRHASARDDSKLAIRIRPTAEAYSTLAKSLFYLKEYEEAVGAFRDTIKLLPEGESLSQFDQAYYQKAQAAMMEEASQSSTPRKSPHKASPVPKLPPPRFVPREQAINSTPNLPPMPKQWPQQSPRSPTALRCGPEREVLFFSESLGIKLNRGPDGVVRVLSVSKKTPGSVVAYKGEINVGDVVREAAGVDIRRPITNIMWGDTVALIRLSPRPIPLIVAKELSEVPLSVLEQRRQAEEEESTSQAQLQTKMGEMKMASGPNYSASPASGDEAVAESPAAQSQFHKERLGHEISKDTIETPSAEDNLTNISGTQEDSSAAGVDESPPENTVVAASQVVDEISEKTPGMGEQNEQTDHAESCSIPLIGMTSTKPGGASSELEQGEKGATNVSNSVITKMKPSSSVSLRDEEMNLLGAEILFPRVESQLSFSGWDNLRWMSYAGARQIQHCMYVEKLSSKDKKALSIFGFGATSSDQFLPRKLVVYSEPSLFLLLRSPNGPDELRDLLDLPADTNLDQQEHPMRSFLVVEAAAEPRSCKMRLSPLTTPTSVSEDDTDVADARRRSCFYLQTPMETIAMTAIAGKPGVSYSDSGAFLETTSAELSVGKALCQAHSQDQEASSHTPWTHQVILGSLHSYVVLGSQKLLEKAIMTAMKRSKDNVVTYRTKACLHTRIVDRLDDRGLTPLHYACLRRFTAACALLVNAGARVDIRTEPLDMAPVHVCAQNLDHKTLSIILSATVPVKANSNLLDSLGRTPMYIAAVNGCGPQKQRDAASLGRCIMALEAWGGQMHQHPSKPTMRSPLSILAAQWRHEELSEVLKHSALRYPLPGQLIGEQVGISIGALYHYPLHSAIISLVKEIQGFYDSEDKASLGSFGDPLDNSLARTTLTLVCHGFEPNERLDAIEASTTYAAEFEEYIGYAPIQLLACAAMEAENLKGRANDGLLERIMKVTADVADALVRNGARLSLDPPPTKRLLALKDEYTSSTGGDGAIIDAYDRSSLKIESNKTLMNLLGGNDRLKASRRIWEDEKTSEAPPTLKVPFENDVAYGEKWAPGANSEKSCAICWTQFGSLMNRKHKCRMSERYVCDDCSTKRVFVEGKEIRFSDGQFLRARAELAKFERESIQAKRAQDAAQIEKMKEAHEKARQSRVSEEAQRETLFGGMMEKAARMVAGEEETEQTPQAQVEGLSDSLGQTRNALLDRGEKLEGLSDKTAQMVDASAEFARMAKELNKKSEWGFW